MLEIVTCQIRRDQIHNDILEPYNENKKSRHFVIYFENEEAVWEGVTCDVYKLFLEHMFQSFLEEENESGISAENWFYRSKCFYLLRGVYY